MKTISTVLISLLLAVLAYLPAIGEDTVIRVNGAHAVSKAVDALGKAFVKEHPGCKVEVSPTGTPKGVREFIEKRSDVILATRPMKPKEMKMAEAKGLKPVKTKVGSDPYAVMVSLDNPVTELTLDQVRKIFKGEYTSWSQVGGPEIPIQIFVLNPQVHGSSEVFRKWVFMGSGKFPSSSTVVTSHRWEIAKVAQTKGGVGAVPAIKAIEAAKQVRTLALKATDESEAVLPTKKNVLDGSYALIREVYFYWEPNTKKPLVREFVEFCQKNGVTSVP